MIGWCQGAGPTMKHFDKLKSWMRGLTHKEVSDLESSYAQIKTVEECVSEHTEAHQAFLHGVYSARCVVMDSAEGLENPMDGLSPAEGDPLTAEEIRAAFQELLRNNDISSEMAKNLSWEQVLRFLNDGGMATEELSDEEIAQPILAIQPPLLSLTREDLAQDIVQMKFLESRRREAESDASWAVLRTHLEDTFRAVSANAIEFMETRKIHAQASQPEFHGIAKLLSRMPLRFRRHAFYLCLCGKSNFQRMPILIPEDETDKFVAVPLDLRIPMDVPVASPNRCPAILTWWDEGKNAWNFLLPYTRKELLEPETIVDLDVNTLREKVESGDTDALHFLNLVELNLSSDVARAWRECTITQDALRHDHDPSVSGDDPWIEVLRKARSILGLNLEAEMLVKYMGGKTRAKTNEIIWQWKFGPRKEIDQPRLREIYRQLIKQTQSAASPEIDPLALQLFKEQVRAPLC
jgi:hypothetical protein